MRGGSELGEEPVVGRCLGDEDESEENLLDARHGPSPSPWSSNSVAADAGATVHTDPGVDRSNGEHAPRYLDLSAGGVGYRESGKNRLKQKRCDCLKFSSLVFFRFTLTP